MRGPGFIKTSPTKERLPSGDQLIKDKLETIPKRRRDRDDKWLKGFIDIHNLVFFNQEKLNDNDRANTTSTGRALGLQFLEPSKKYGVESTGGRYVPLLDSIGRWIRTQSANHDRIPSMIDMSMRGPGFSQQFARKHPY